MNKLLIALSLLAAFAAGALLTHPVSAQQSLTLTTPQTTTVSALHIGGFCASFDNNTLVAEVHTASHSLFAMKPYDASTTPTGATLLHALNTGNFTVTSLWQAIINRLTTDGVVPAGSVTGTAQ